MDRTALPRLADWLALPFTARERTVRTSVDARWVRQPATTVQTPPGVCDDYYGNPRGPTTWAGAVGDESPG
jgi:hypothetical protein